MNYNNNKSTRSCESAMSRSCESAFSNTVSWGESEVNVTAHNWFLNVVPEYDACVLLASKAVLVGEHKVTLVDLKTQECGMFRSQRRRAGEHPVYWVAKVNTEAPKPEIISQIGKGFGLRPENSWLVTVLSPHYVGDFVMIPAAVDCWRKNEAKDFWARNYASRGLEQPYEDGVYTLILDSLQSTDKAVWLSLCEQFKLAPNTTRASSGSSLNTATVGAYRAAADARALRFGTHQDLEPYGTEISMGLGQDHLLQENVDPVEPGYLGFSGSSAGEELRNVSISEITFSRQQPAFANVSLYWLRSLATSVPDGYTLTWSSKSFPYSTINQNKMRVTPPDSTLDYSGGRLECFTPYNLRNEVSGSDAPLQVQTMQYVWGTDMCTVKWNLTQDYKFAVDIELLRRFAIAIQAGSPKKEFEDFASTLAAHREINVKLMATKPSEDVNGVRVEYVANLARTGRYGSYVRCATRAWLYAFAYAIVEKFASWGEDCDVGNLYDKTVVSDRSSDLMEGFNYHQFVMAGPVAKDYGDVKGKIRARPFLPNNWKSGGSVRRLEIFGVSARPFDRPDNNGRRVPVVWGAGFANAGNPVGESDFWNDILHNGSSGWTDGSTQMIDCSNMSPTHIQMLLHCLEDGETAFRIQIGITRADANYRFTWLRRLFGMDMSMPGAKKVFLHFGTMRLRDETHAEWDLQDAIRLTRRNWDGLPQHKYSFEAWRDFIGVVSSKLGCEGCFTHGYELATLYTFGYNLAAFAPQGTKGSFDWSRTGGKYARDQFSGDSVKNNILNAEHIRGWFPLGRATIPADVTLCEYFRPCLPRKLLVGPLSIMVSEDRDTIFAHSRLLNQVFSFARTTAHMALNFDNKTISSWLNEAVQVPEFSWIQRALERPMGMRSESMLDAVTASICAFAVGFAPSLLTRTHIDYTHVNEVRCNNWDVWTFEESVMLWNWPYADLEIYNSIPEIWMLPTRDTRPSWPEGFEKPVPNSVEGTDYVPLADTVNPMSINMWMNDGGQAYSAQHFMCADQNGSVKQADISHVELLARPHPYSNERRVADQKVKFMRLPAPLSNYVNQGAFVTFKHQGRLRNTWAYSVATPEAEDILRSDWTMMIMEDHPKSFCRATIECRRYKSDMRVESRAVDYGYAKLINRTTKQPLTYAAIKFSGGKAERQINSSGLSKANRLPAHFANVNVPGLMTAMTNAYNATIWRNGLSTIRRGAKTMSNKNGDSINPGLVLKNANERVRREEVRAQAEVLANSRQGTAMSELVGDEAYRKGDELPKRDNRNTQRQQFKTGTVEFMNQHEIAKRNNIGSNFVAVLPDIHPGLYGKKKVGSQQASNVEKESRNSNNNKTHNAMVNKPTRGHTVKTKTARDAEDEYHLSKAELENIVKAAVDYNKQVAHKATDYEATRMQQDAVVRELDNEGAEYEHTTNEQEYVDEQLPEEVAQRKFERPNVEEELTIEESIPNVVSDSRDMTSARINDIAMKSMMQRYNMPTVRLGN